MICVCFISESRSIAQKIVDIFLFLWSVINSAMVSLIVFLNKYSRDYRYVLKVLNVEKKLLKVGRPNVWESNSSVMANFRSKPIIISA